MNGAPSPRPGSWWSRCAVASGCRGGSSGNLLLVNKWFVPFSLCIASCHVKPHRNGFLAPHHAQAPKHWDPCQALPREVSLLSTFFHRRTAQSTCDRRSTRSGRKACNNTNPGIWKQNSPERRQRTQFTGRKQKRKPNKLFRRLKRRPNGRFLLQDEPTKPHRQDPATKSPD